jgi:OOP family OmpA-OmpF porin
MKPLTLLTAIAFVMLAGTAEAKHRHAMQTQPLTKADFESQRTLPVKCCVTDADMDGDGVPDRYDRCGNTPAGCKVDDYGCPWDTDQDGVCDGLDQCPDTPPGEVVDAEGCDAAQRAARGAPHVQTTSRPAESQPMPPPAPPQSEVEKKLIATGEIRLENVYFDTGKSTLLPESEASLNEAGHALEHFSALKVEVGGHTDTRGSAKYNQKLSQVRAEAVRSYLLDHFHLDPANYVAKGYGESHPEVKERNDEDRQRNRRVVLKVLNPGALPRGVEVKH